MIQGQSGDDRFLSHRPAGPANALGLQQVRNDIAVCQHGALGNTGRTAGVLQKCHVFEGDIDRVQRQFVTLVQTRPGTFQNLEVSRPVWSFSHTVIQS